MNFSVTILGSGAALPTGKRNPSAQLLNIRDQYILIDCGEGTQIQLRRAKVKLQRISTICISHLHGDHFYGLPGLLFTMHLLRREEKLTIIAPPELKNIMELLKKVSYSEIMYPIEYIDLKENEIFDIQFDKEMLFKIKTFPLKHTIPTWGFLFEEKPILPNIKKEKIEEYNIPFTAIPLIKQGADYVLENETIINNNELIIPAPKIRKYAYCADTAYDTNLEGILRNIDMLYHEATFGEDEKKLAESKGHSTATDAAKIAKACNIDTLLLGHFSARYDDAEELEKQAQTVFKNTIAVKDLETYSIKFRAGIF